MFLNFCADAGFLKTRPASVWQTVEGGGRVYGKKLLQHSARKIYLNTRIEKVSRKAEGVQIRDQHGHTGIFDHVVLATHADTALGLLEDPSETEHALLKAFQYRQNTALLHLDRNLMPKRKALWSGSNYIERNTRRKSSKNFCVTFWMNRLQGLSGVQDIFITIDPEKPPPPEKILSRQINRRPILDKAAIAAQNQIEFLQGHRNTWFCGGYFGHGFHEDSVEAGLSVAEKIGPSHRPWHVKQRQPETLAFA
jgi:predicted NAD/FAD-binding protein